MNGKGGYRTKIAGVRAELAAMLNCDAEDLVLVDNASNAINVLLARLGLSKQPLNATAPFEATAAVLLDLSVAYGPFQGLYRWLTASRGVEIMTADLSFPSTNDEIVASVKAALDARLASGQPMPQVAVVDQVASVPALNLPVRALTQLLHSYDVLVIVDGAHALGNVPCDFAPGGELEEVDAWFANAHKWLMAPKSAAVLYVRKDHHATPGGVPGGVWPEPTVVDS